MSTRASPTPARAAATPTRGGLLQRRCACGTGGALLGGACPDCSKKRRTPLQTKLRIGRADDALEREADQTADRVLRGEHLPSALSRVSASVQRDGPATGDAPKTTPQDTPNVAPKDTPKAPAEGDAGATAAGTATTAPTCDPQGFKRADYLKQPGTSTNDFGLTQLTASSATVPAVVTKPAKGGVTLEPTTAALPTIPSVYTAADTFIEGEAHFLGSGGRYDCPSGKKPIQWTITPKGADKIREGELDHCADFQLAFDLSLQRYADAVNALAGKRVFANQAAAVKALKKVVGVHPDDWFSTFTCLAGKTLIRDKRNWHKPIPKQPPDRDSAHCDVVRLRITESSLPEVGQAKHPASEIIKDCGEAGAKAASAGPVKVSAADPDDGVLEPGAEGETDEMLMQRRAGVDDALSGTPAPDLVQSVLDSPGQALDEPTRAFMEPRFGRDFSHVRVHTNDQAARSALSVNALAYTVDHHVVFGSGAYDPAGSAGRQLLAHELAHVVQQTDNGRPVVARRPRGRTNFRRDRGLVSGEDLLDAEFTDWLGSLTKPELRDYRTVVYDPAVLSYIDNLLTPNAIAGVEPRGLQVTDADMTSVEGLNYWEQRVLRTIHVRLQTDRLAKSAEEHDAVWAALAEAIPPLPLATASTAQVEIPASAQRPNALLYRFSFTPRTPGQKLDMASIGFVAERQGRIVEVAKDLPLAYKAPTLSFDTEMGFDQGADPYWKAHPEEKRQVAYAVLQASGNFDLFLQTRSPAQGTTAAHEATLRVQGQKDAKGNTRQLSIELVSEGRLEQARTPRDYRQRDYGDLLISEAQTKPSPKGDLLGRVETGNVPPAEQVAVKLSIANYFSVIGSRNTEVNAVVPVPSARQRVFYKFFFRDDNEVDVQRVGVEGASPKLDPNALDVARVEGFDANADTPAALKSWLAKRYPKVKPTGTTVADLQASTNAQMRSAADGAGTAAWFINQYAVQPLNASGLASRLKAAHGKSAASVVDTKDMASDELKLVERGIQTLPDPLVPLLKQLRLGRKARQLKADGTADEETLPDGTTRPYGGMTFTTGAERTVVYLDGMLSTSGQFQFRGDANRVNRTDTHIVLHEFGHVVAGKTGAQAAFNAFVKKEGIAPFTAYAQRHPTKEFFEDAFDMFQSNPSFLAQAHPRLHQWFTLLTTTGKVPAKLP